MIKRSPYFQQKNDGSYDIPRFDLEKLSKYVLTLPQPDAEHSSKQYQLALNVLKAYFGSDWLIKHILDEPKDGFFGRHLGNDYGANLTMHRVADLAELVINLTDVVGVEAPFKQLVHGEIESAIAELGVGRLCKRRGLPFRFVVPSGCKGNDYDIEVVFPNSETVCLDAKCKFENNHFSENSMFNSLKEARNRNLPKGRPCAIVVKIPHAWVSNQSNFTAMENVIWRFLGDAKRIVSVIVYSVFIDVVENRRLDHEWGWEYVNTKSTFSPEKDWRMLGYNRGAPTDLGFWTKIIDIVARYRPSPAVRL